MNKVENCVFVDLLVSLFVRSTENNLVNLCDTGSYKAILFVSLLVSLLVRYEIFFKLFGSFKIFPYLCSVQSS